jgi:hypothetical protein
MTRIRTESRSPLSSLSGLGTLAAAVLTQYRVSELERLRATGRIGCQSLRLKAQYKLPTLAGDERLDFIDQMFDELTKIEIKQNEGFYAHFSGKTKES